MSEKGKYTYFNQFLFDLACDIPQLAKELIEKYEKDSNNQLKFARFDRALKISFGTV